MDLYSILGLAYPSSENEIKISYRKLVNRYHPDKKNGNEEKFKEIQNAYDTLSNRVKKEKYDNVTYKTSKYTNYGNFGYSSGKYYNTDYDYRLAITLEDAFVGSTFDTGQGLLKIKKGAKTGDRYFLGKFTVEIIVEDHTLFSRTNNDLLVKIDIDYISAIFGKKHTLMMLDGKYIDVTIPEMVSYDQVIVLENKGMFCEDKNKYGDLFIQLKLVPPTYLTNRHKSAILSVLNQ